VYVDDDVIRDLVIRLSRPDASGGRTIERAVILAEGSHMAEIVTWILARGGTAEAVPAATSTGGLHGPRRTTGESQTSVPLRYVLPAGALN
jgi:hypothetical protein